jgi:hypothetical protein
MDIWNLVAERKIREAMEEGAFDHLEGKGQPLDLEENPYLDPALRMAHRILRNNGFAPAWIEEGKDLDVDIRRLRESREQCGPGEFRRRAAELNRRILAYNLKVPVVSAQKAVVKE